MECNILCSKDNCTIWDVPTQNPEKVNQFSRFGGLSFFHNVDLLRRKPSPEVYDRFPVLKKVDKAFTSFLQEIEVMRAQTPCIVGRFGGDELMAMLSSVTVENIDRTLAAFEGRNRENLLYKVDHKCAEDDVVTHDIHVSILGYLTVFETEKREDEQDFYQFAKRKFFSRIDTYVTALIQLNAQESDIEGLMGVNPLEKRVKFAHEITMGIASYRCGFLPSSWETRKPFEFFADEIKQKGSHILYGKFPPFCYKAHPTEKGEISGRSIVGWDAGAERINRLFESSIVVVGFKKGERKNLLFYISPYTYYESSQIYVSSYETICELALYCFNQTYAVYLN